MDARSEEEITEEEKLVEFFLRGGGVGLRHFTFLGDVHLNNVFSDEKFFLKKTDEISISASYKYYSQIILRQTFR